MKRFVCALLALCLLGLGGCSSPDRLQMDLSQGYGENLKLLHLNASSKANLERILAFGEVFREAAPLDKEFRLFAYYPDYRLSVQGASLHADENGFALEQDGGSFTAVLDLNGGYLDFYFPTDDGEEPVIYRAATTAREFLALVHQA